MYPPAFSQDDDTRLKTCFPQLYKPKRKETQGLIFAQTIQIANPGVNDTTLKLLGRRRPRWCFICKPDILSKPPMIHKNLHVSRNIIVVKPDTSDSSTSQH